MIAESGSFTRICCLFQDGGVMIAGTDEDPEARVLTPKIGTGGD
jgi:hypothetical protein